MRFDPLIYVQDYRKLYAALFAETFALINPERVHSVSLGGFRLPEPFFKKMYKLYPDAKLFASPLHTAAGMVSYRRDLEQAMLADCLEMLAQYLPAERIFPCQP